MQGDGPPDLRLEDNPFVFKLCKPTLAEQSTTDLVPGLYLTIRAWNQLAESPAMRGLRGGFVVGYHNLTRWLTNTQFIDLVGSGWLGSHRGASDLIRDLVKRALKLERSTVLAIASGDRQRPTEGQPADWGDEDSFFEEDDG